MGSTEVAPDSYTAAKDSVQDAFDALSAAKRAYEEAVKQFGTRAIRDGLDRVMKLLNVNEVMWTQYTPYFNDGDPCEFGVKCISIRTDDPDEADDEYEDSDGNDAYWKEFYGWSHSSQNEKDAQEILKKLYAMDEIFLTAFGDHARVTYNGKDFTVTDYEHD